jgi:outer membrane protein OmpA-like peptidoglycan-associated protein
MRHFCVALTALFGMAVPALAQVTVDLHALDALPGAKPAGKEHAVQHPTPKPAQRRVASKPTPPPEPTTETPAATPSVATASPAPTTAPATATPATVTPPPATLPTAPPPTVALAPVTPPPQVAQAAPPPPPITDSAASEATNTGSGLRVTFGAGDANLSPASAAAIKTVVQSAPGGGSTSFNVVAYAAGAPEDPSTARRLSLSRALAVRSALIADGVDSSRIYVRALGAAGGAEAPDRVDLAVMGGNAPAPAADAGAKSQSP